MKVREALWTLRGKRLAVLGLAFKGGTDDCRDSPAVDIVKRLYAEGAKLIAFDPVAMARAKSLLPDGMVAFAGDAYEACVGADAVVVLTEWPEFAQLDWLRVRQSLNLPIVLDGKTLLDPTVIRAAGLRYFAIGFVPDALDIPQSRLPGMTTGAYFPPKPDETPVAYVPMMQQGASKPTVFDYLK
jgi:UDPglucose 6-dehydrogenase